MNDRIDFAEWVGVHGVRLRSLELNGPLDELEPLRDIVGDARVVALGESSHHVREFYQARHRMLRFLVERCGFTVYALEAPFTEGHALDAWVNGEEGTAQEVADGLPLGLGKCQEMYDMLEWARSRSRSGMRPDLRVVGTDLPGSMGSPLPALAAVETYLRWADPESLPFLWQAIELARHFHDPATFKALAAYGTLDEGRRDALSATLGHLLARMERATTYQRDQGHQGEHALALHHLRGAWGLDQLHRANSRTDDFEAVSTFRDAYIAQSVQRLLDTGGPGTRIVLGAHNWHIKRTPTFSDGTVPLLPAGYHLAGALGNDYRAIALTSNRGRTAIARPTPGHPEGFAFYDVPLPDPLADSVEAAFGTDAPWTLANLRTAARAVGDADTFQTMRMSSHFVPDRAFDAFDAVATISRTTCTDYALPEPPRR